MKFRLEFDIEKLKPPVTHLDKMMLIGSCFTENMGEKLARYKFPVLMNPNGILFNPVSVAEAISSYIENRKVTEADVFPINEGWHSWKHHSRFSSPSAVQTLQWINESNADAHSFLKEAGWLLITLGSAWVYSLTENAAGDARGTVAANNHKAPASWFTRSLLHKEDVIHLLTGMIEKLSQFNPQLQIIFTISPVRHVREGVIDNNRSKAVLIQAIHELKELYSHLHYFPAYELVIDDLRDYRYYSEDLVHPNYFATQYVWEKFSASCMNETTRQLMDEIHSINLAYTHRAFSPDSTQHQKFLSTFYNKTRELQLQHPYLDFKKELEYFNRQSK